MAKAKGTEKSGGRIAGTQNKTTQKAKEIILNAIDTQSTDFSKTMDVIKVKSPVEWAKIMVKLMDFVLPKKLDITSDGEKFIAPTIVLDGNQIKP